MSGVPSSSRSADGARRSRPRTLRPHTSGSSKADQPKIKSRRNKLDDTTKVMIDETMMKRHNQPNDNVDIEKIPDIDIVSSKNKIDSYTTLIDSSDDESIKSMAVHRRKFFASKKGLPDRSNPFKKIAIATPNDTSTDESLLVKPKKMSNKANQKKKSLSLPTDDVVAVSLDESTETVSLEKSTYLLRKRRNSIKKWIPDNQFSESSAERSELHHNVFEIIKTEERNSNQSMDEWQNLPSSTLMENQIIKHMSIDMAEIKNVAEDETSNILVLDQVQEYQHIKVENQHKKIHGVNLQAEDKPEKTNDNQKENLKQNRKSQQKKNLDIRKETEEDIVTREPVSQEEYDYDEQLEESSASGDESLKSPEIMLNTATNASAPSKKKTAYSTRNTSVRKTKNALFKPSLLPARKSTEVDTSQNTTGEGSGWNSHRTTRKTLRQTFGRHFSPRKSPRTLVLEKEAKRKTYDNNVETPANTTEIPVMFDQEEEIDHEADRLKQAKLDMLFEKIKSEIMEEKRMIEEKVMKSLQTTSNSNSYNTFKVPTRPAVKCKATTKPQIKSKKFQPTLVSDMELPEEFLQDLKFKPPRRYKPRNAAWATKRLYNYLEKKLEPKYSYQKRVRAERLVMQLHEWVMSVRRCKVAPPAGVEVIAKDFARLGIVTTYFEFYDFIKDYLPMEFKIKVVPDIMNGIPSPSGGVFSNILDSNT